MYQDLNTRPSANSPKPFSVDLSSIQLDERVAYVNSVCSTLIDSRFGPGRAWPMMTDLRFGPDREPAVFCDMTVEGPVPSYTILPDSEMARRYSNEIIRDELERINREAASVHANRLSPSTQPRGSPSTLGRGSS